VTRVGIIGGSGFGGAELLRLCASHPEFTVVFATADSQADTRVAGLYPSLAPAYPDLAFVGFDPVLADDVDLVFLALPHGASQAIVAQIHGRVRWIVDLGSDFRFDDAAVYPEWYGGTHSSPHLLDEFAYGLPELFRDEIAAATSVAVPGCYPTAAALALAPLTRNGLIETSGIVIDAVSGVSGAGRDKIAFCAADEDVSAYGLLRHRHTPEIERVIGAQVLFTPHLVPMNRGMLATCYSRPSGPASTDDVREVFAKFYADEPFVTLVDGSPHTKAVQGSNSAHVSVLADDRTGFVVSLCAIDNLGKGAAGQAMQCANLLVGLPETTGVPTLGVYP
jgi:N-acetyl-gamma-glutamyl-phosphate reductase